MYSSPWTPLKSQSDLDHLITIFGHFHDGCLRESHVWTEHFVCPDLSMHCSPDLDTRVRLLIQRQRNNPSAVELFFEEVVTFHLKPSPHNYDSIIYDATMIMVGDLFYWADTGGWCPDSSDKDEFTWIASKKVSWRDASDWMGSDLRYGNNDVPEV